jgi:hypothetical protein
MLDPSVFAFLASTPSGYYGPICAGAQTVAVKDSLALANTSSVSGYARPLVDTIVEDVTRAFFEERVREWLADTAWESSVSTITAHPRFAEVVGMQESALKFILEKMEAGDVHIHWFPALKRIAQHDPVLPEHRGFVPEMTRAWIDWGRDTGRI